MHSGEPTFKLRTKPLSKKEEKEEYERELRNNHNINFAQPKWIYSTNNWPDQRYNWPAMTTLQKNYLIASYNKQRFSRGMAPIPNPYKDNLYEPGPDYITPPTPGREKIYNNPLFMGDKNQKLPYNPNMPGSADRRIRFPGLIEIAFNKPRDKLSTTERELVTDFKNYARSTQGIKDIADAKNISDPVSGTPNKRPHEEDEGSAENTLESPDKAQRIDSAKRPADQIESPNPKKPFTPPAKTTEKDMTLPGTAGEEAKTTKTGNAFSGGFDSASGPLIHVARPLTMYKTGEIVFSKVIRILTYGLAPTNQKLYDTSDSYRVMTSSLAEIPWDRLFMYMNPGEFKSLPTASFAKHAHCSIVQRNPRVAFETGSSTTSLATLNQNKFGVKAIGLNKNKMLRGQNVKLSGFATGEPMIPTANAVPKYNKFPEILYGVSQEDELFDSDVPAQPFMVPVAVQHYWGTISYASTLPNPVASSRQNCGWPDLSKYVTQFDMNATAGTEIISCDYTFNRCPLTAQLGAVNYLNQGVEYYQPQPKIAKITRTMDVTTAQNFAATQTGDIEINQSNYALPSSLFDIIDKSYAYGDDSRNEGFSRSIMPSIHVGISPVPRLNTKIGGGEIASWTDVQAYFEVKCTLTVGYHMDHSSTQYEALHTIPEDLKMGAEPLIGDTNEIHATNPIQFGMWCKDLP